MPSAWRIVSASACPTGPPRFDRGASGANENNESARKSAIAPPVIASASRRMWLGADAGRPLAIPSASAVARHGLRHRPPLHPSGRPSRPGAIRLLHLEHEGEDDRPALQPLEISTERLPDLLLHLGRIGARLRIHRRERTQDLGPGPLH